MKKLLICLMAGVLAIAVAACGTGTDAATAGGETDAAGLLDEGETAVDESEETKPEGSVSADKITVEVAEEEEAADDAGEEEAEEPIDVPDVSDAVVGSVTSATAAVPFGAWVKTALYATQDTSYHTVYVRVVRVTTQSEDAAYVNAAIETNNVYGDADSQIDPADMEIPEDAELVVMDYEVYVPADFPAPRYGMTEPKIYFSMRTIDGGGFPSQDGSTVYAGIGTAQELVVREAGETYLPGYTYTERCLYTMVSEYTKYVATYASYPDGTASDETSADNMYTVYHSID